MQTRLSIQTLLALILSVAICRHSLADDSPQSDVGIKNPAAFRVAIIDVKRVFDQHERHQKEIKRLKAEIVRLTAEVKTRTKALGVLESQLGKDGLGEEARKKLTGVLLTARSELKVFSDQNQKKILDEEAHLYASVYEEIREIVSQLARNRHTQLVLHYSEPGGEWLKKKDVLPLVLFQEGIDLTDDVIDRISQPKGDSEKPSAEEFQADGETTAVAVVDLKKLMAAYPPHAERLTLLTERQRDMERAITERREKLEVLETKIGSLTEGSDEHSDLVKKVALERAELEFQPKANEQLIEADTGRAAAQTVKEINRLIEAFAKKRELSLVFNADSTRLDPKDRQGVLKGVNRRIVYWSDLDVTADILKAMGKEQDSSDASDAEKASAEKQFRRKIALIDMAVAFKDNDDLKTQMTKLQQEVSKFEAHLQVRKNQLEDLQSLLNAMTAGTEEHLNTSKQLAREMGELKAEMELKKLALMRKEAQHFAATYERIHAVVARTARAQDIGLVIRFDSSSANLDERQGVLSAVNRGVVFQDLLDLTDEVTRLAKDAPSIELR